MNITDKHNDNVAILAAAELLIAKTREEATQVARRRVVCVFEVCEHLTTGGFECFSIRWKSVTSTNFRQLCGLENVTATKNDSVVTGKE